MNPHTQPPKILSWLAVKAGISFALSNLLWQEACRDAAYHAEPGSSHYFALAVDRLVELVAAESLRRDAASLGFRPWARAQARLIAATIYWLDAYHQMVQRNLRALTGA